MTEQEQRISIAEACGWKKLPKTGLVAGTLREWICPDYGKWGRFVMYEEIPDFVNDLNAMHAAEKILTDFQHEEFARILWGPKTPIRKAVSATAAQRSEAFLRCLGKWNETL